jgi:lipopolysaccharide transport system permease protein
MLAYLGSIWKCRNFWLSLVINDMRLRYRRSVLGVGWSLLHPLTTAFVTGVVFCEIFKMPIRELLPFVLSGLACWAYITGVTVQGCQSYVQAESYIRQHPLPLAVYPLRTTLGAMIHFLIALVLVFGLASVFRNTADVSAGFLLIPGIALFFLFGWAVAILAGFVNTIFRDTQHILEVVFQILFYLTPLVYPMRMLSETRVGWLLRYNPVVPFLKLIREPLLEGRTPSLTCYAVATAITLLLGAAAIASLGYQQRRVILYL